MQKLDNSKDYIMQDIQGLIDDLKKQNQITEKEAENINVRKVYNFTQTEIWQRMKKAKEIHKEKAFYINVPIKEVYTEVTEENLEGNILVQGIIDLYFIDENDKLVLLDYKTDYVETGKEHQLIRKYQIQLDLYEKALEESLHRKVDEVYIYSTWMDKLIQK
jgi:ATP-dependent helicase/nuclease subunit A